MEDQPVICGVCHQGLQMRTPGGNPLAGTFHVVAKEGVARAYELMIRESVHMFDGQRWKEV